MPLFSLAPHLSTHARWLYPLLVVVLATVLGQFFGLGLALLVVAGGVLIGAIWLIWASLSGLNENLPITLDEALSLGAPSAEEEQKRAVLRALKDLEYERAVGKINEEDYTALAQHYRTEAKRLLRAVDLDLSPERQRAERLLEERLATLRRSDSKQAATGSGANEDDAKKSRSESARPEGEHISEPAAVKAPSSDTAL